MEGEITENRPFFTAKPRVFHGGFKQYRLFGGKRRLCILSNSDVKSCENDFDSCRADFDSCGASRKTPYSFPKFGNFYSWNISVEMEILHERKRFFGKTDDALKCPEISL